MRRTTAFASVLVAALAIVAFAAVRRPAMQQDDLASAPRISQKDFKKALVAGSVLVLDVRDAGAYASGHVPGAVSVPLADLSQHIDELKAERRPIVTYCA